MVINPLSTKILSGELVDGMSVELGIADGNLTVVSR